MSDFSVALVSICHMSHINIIQTCQNPCVVFLLQVNEVSRYSNNGYVCYNIIDLHYHTFMINRVANGNNFSEERC